MDVYISNIYPSANRHDLVEWMAAVTNIVEHPLNADVIVFPGGFDVHPSLYGDEIAMETIPHLSIDYHDIRVFNMAYMADIPMVGICRGAQFLTAMAGGKLFQDVTGHAGGEHEIKIHELLPGVQNNILKCNSTHHQMMNPFLMNTNDYLMLAHTEKPISRHYVGTRGYKTIPPPVEPEIIYYPKIEALAIQGHPERYDHNHAFTRYCRHLVRKYVTN